MESTTRTKKGSDPFKDMIVSSLKAGAFAGSAGFLVGGTAGILKAQTPFLYAVASSIQTGVLGTTFWGFRSTILNAWSTREITRRDRTIASTISGSLSGSLVGGITRGRANVFPAAIMFGLFGSLGQHCVNRYTEPVNNQPNHEEKDGFWRRMAGKTWSPITIMSDSEYANMLNERALKLDVEIAILDDKITAERRAIAEKEKQHTEEKKPNASG